jgi:uncharacterized repeat protein (TIGR02543 family)
MKNGAYSFAFLLISQLFARAAWHELLVNTNFEQTSPVVWAANPLFGGNSLSAGIVNLGNARSGSWYAYVGDHDNAQSNSIGAVTQVVSVPSGTTQIKLNFYLDITSQETTVISNFDNMGVYLRTFPADVRVITFHEWSNLNKDSAGNKTNYLLQTYSTNTSTYSGQQMTLEFYGKTDNSKSTTFRIDDASLQAYVPDYSVTASAGTGGSISPSGAISAEYGQTLNFTATPAANYAVDVWYVNGSPVRTNDTSVGYGVAGNATVNVTFKKAAYDLNISSPHGHVEISLQSQGAIQPHAYTPNSQLILVPFPDSGYVFTGWTGDISGFAQPFNLLLDNDKTITANFIPQAPQMSLSTPIMTIPDSQTDPTFGFKIPTKLGWKYLVRVKRNGQDASSYLTVINGTGDVVNVVDSKIKNYSTSIYLVSAEPNPAGPILPFMTFPLTNDNQAELTAYNAKITAVYDNEGPDNVANGGILLFTGQLITFGKNRCMGLDANQNATPSGSFTDPNYLQFGYKADEAGSDISLPINYLDLDPSTPGNKGTIWYDGHTGYDYAYDSSAHVLSATSGKVVGDGESIFGHDKLYNRLVIDNQHGYRVAYLHMSKWEKEFAPGEDVNEGQKIGYPGDIDKFGLHDKHVHLHITVTKMGTDGQWREVDPYGLRAEDGSEVLPVLWKKQTP